MIKVPSEEQLKIIQYDGNTVVTAKPGSGKTYTIVEKIAKILPDLPSYKGVIAISYTNKASDELKKRCWFRCADTKQSFFGTIDKFYISQIIIPFSCHITGVLREYQIIDKIDASSKYYPLTDKNSGLTPREYALINEGLQEGIIILNRTGETALYILDKVEGALKYIKAKYSHIIIDEYQDCGDIQNRIFIKLVESGLTGIAVGDINQAIFGFDNRFPKYLMSLLERNDFMRFQLDHNHRCHPGISEYSLCLYKASKEIPSEKRVFKVACKGDERNIAKLIDKYLEQIKRKYEVNNNNQVAILCRTNTTISLLRDNLKTPHKVFDNTELDDDNSEWGRLFRYLLTACFDDNIGVVDFVEQFYSEEYEPRKYREALLLCDSIFSCSLDDFLKIEGQIIAFAKLVYPDKEDSNAIKLLNAVLSEKSKLYSYIPASENEINIMTLHKSKGLEFNIVFHMDMYQYIIPNPLDKTVDSEQQSLNLHYVGITRAIDACYIMIGEERFSKKKNTYYPAIPSQFLDIYGLSDRRKDVKWHL